MTYSTLTILVVFYLAFLSQIFLISVYYPAKFYRRVRYVLDNYPPSRYPKLYPKPFDTFAEDGGRKSLRLYRVINNVIAVIGLMILSAMLVSDYRPHRLGGDEVFVLMYFFLQALPLLYSGFKETKHYQLMRKEFSETTRQANLTPRRLFDFVSPVYVVLAVVLYVVWIVFYLSGQDLSAAWEPEVYITLGGLTGMNVFLAFMIARVLYGKKTDPYQSHKDQMRSASILIKIILFTSIGSSTVLMITQAADQYGWEVFDPVITSIYMQLCAVFGIGLTFRALEIESIDFDVYKNETGST